MGTDGNLHIVVTVDVITENKEQLLKKIQSKILEMLPQLSGAPSMVDEHGVMSITMGNWNIHVSAR